MSKAYLDGKGYICHGLTAARPGLQRWDWWFVFEEAKEYWGIVKDEALPMDYLGCKKGLTETERILMVVAREDAACEDLMGGPPG